MQEIRCPKCGEVFQVDDSGYDQIAQQVRDREFEKELDRRKKDLDAKREQELEIIRLQEEKEHTASITQKDAEISEKDQKIAELQAKLDASETAKKLAVAEAVEQKNVESKYFILGSSGTKNAIDKHHIFPKNYLTGIGFTSDRDRNQIANFTYLDYATNIEISDKAPQDYVSHYRQKLGEEGYRKTCKEHALPDNFENMDYMEFLSQRRILMAQTVRKAYQRLCE